MLADITCSLTVVGLNSSGILGIAGYSEGSAEAGSSFESSAAAMARSKLSIGLSRIMFVSLIEDYNSGLAKHTDREIRLCYAGTTKDIIEIDQEASKEIEAQLALAHVASTACGLNLGTEILPELFTMAQLHSVYSQLWPECKLDLPNFTRKIKKSKTVEEAGVNIGKSKGYIAAITKRDIRPPFDRQAILRG